MPLSGPYQIVLSGDEQAVLAARAGSVRGPFRDRLRARIVLAAADGRVLTDLLERGDREGRALPAGPRSPRGPRRSASG